MIELLVVIAIIVVLASLLFPSLARAKATAHSAKCKSNLRQLGLGLGMYVNDFSVYPKIKNAEELGTGWAPALNGYLDEPMMPQTFYPNLNRFPGGVFSCPSDKRSRWHGPGGSYGYNSVGAAPAASSPGTLASDPKLEPLGLGGRGIHLTRAWRDIGDTGPNYPEAVPESAVRVPSEMIALADDYVGAPFLPGRPIPTDQVHLEPYESYGSIAREGGQMFLSLPSGRKRHQSKLNQDFCDGHVEGTRVDRLFLSKNALYPPLEIEDP